MMTKDQQITVTEVYRRFLESDGVDKEWTNLDTQMEMIAWIDDPQLVVEAAVMYQIQIGGTPRCNQDHPQSKCFVPIIIDAVEFILQLYGDTGQLHEKNKFILQYYLGLSQVGFIIY